MKLRHPDVVVVGVGRSGTSFTAMVLHEHLDVFMAHPQRMVTTAGEDSSHPIGSYEDNRIISPTYKQVETSDADMQDWLKIYGFYFGAIKGLVGIKNTGMSMFSRTQWEQLAPRLVIRTHRTKELAVKSMERWRGRETDWGLFYDQRENCMRDNLDANSDKRHSFQILHIKYGCNKVHVENLIHFLRPRIEKLRGT